MPAGRVLAARDMTAERRRAAVLDGAHDFELAETDVAAVRTAPCGAVIAENIRDLQQGPGHGGRLFRLAVLRAQWCQPVKRAHHLTDDVGRHMGVTRRRF
jgi:hypothetical protein